MEKYASSIELTLFCMGALADVPLNELDIQSFQGAVDTALSPPVGWQYCQRRALPDIEAWGQGKPRLGKATVHNALLAVAAAWRAAADLGLVRCPPLPLTKLVAEQKQEHKRVPSAGEADRLCALPRPRGIDAVAWEFLPWAGRHAGERLGELCQLTRGSFKEIDKVLCIEIVGDLKTEHSHRLVPVSDKPRPHVERLLAKAPPTGPSSAPMRSF